MGNTILQTPFLLYEAVDMLFRFVNGVSYRSYLSQRLVADNANESDRLARKLGQLQQILEETCRDLDPYDPKLRRYFAWVDTGTNQEGTCLAYFLTLSFLTLKEHDFWKNVEELRASWHRLQVEGQWIERNTIRGLIFTQGEGCPGDLLDQICALNLPPDFQINLCRALRDYDQSLDELANLIWPVVQRLEKTIQKANWILEETVRYWQDAPVNPLDFFTDILGWEEGRATERKTTMVLSLMNHNVVMCNSPVLYPGEDHIYTGCGLDMQCEFRDQTVSYETLSVALKALSDKKRLEILARLSRGRAYGNELAEAMGIAPSNMSRSLALLCNYGFIRQEREGQKNYYEADEGVILHFLRQLEKMLTKHGN